MIELSCIDGWLAGCLLLTLFLLLTFFSRLSGLAHVCALLLQSILRNTTDRLEHLFSPLLVCLVAITSRGFNFVIALHPNSVSRATGTENRINSVVYGEWLLFAFSI